MSKKKEKKQTNKFTPCPNTFGETKRKMNQFQEIETINQFQEITRKMNIESLSFKKRKQQIVIHRKTEFQLITGYLMLPTSPKTKNNTKL